MTAVPVADLLAGDLIPTDLCGDLLVGDVDDDARDEEHVYVDVTVLDRRDDRWDPDDLPAATGAEAYHFLTMTDGLRYRLRYQRSVVLDVKSVIRRDEE